MKQRKFGSILKHKIPRTLGEKDIEVKPQRLTRKLTQLDTKQSMFSSQMTRGSLPTLKKNISNQTQISPAASKQQTSLLTYGSYVRIYKEKTKSGQVVMWQGKGLVDQTLGSIACPKNSEIFRTSDDMSCWFAIYPDFDHTTAKTFRDTLASYDLQHPERTVISDSEAQKYLELLVQFDDYFENNASFAAKMMGEPVQYGSIVQLVNVQSQKFLKVKDTSEDEQRMADIFDHGEQDDLDQVEERYKIYFSAYSSDCSKFRIHPRYSYQQRGDAFILQGDQFYLSFLDTTQGLGDLNIVCEMNKAQVSKRKSFFRFQITPQFGKMNEDCKVNIEPDSKTMVEEFGSCYAKSLDRKMVWISHVELNALLLPILQNVIETAKQSKSGYLRRDPVLSNLLNQFQDEIKDSQSSEEEEKEPLKTAATTQEPGIQRDGESRVQRNLTWNIPVLEQDPEREKGSLAIKEQRNDQTLSPEPLSARREKQKVVFSRLTKTGARFEQGGQFNVVFHQTNAERKIAKRHLVIDEEYYSSDEEEQNQDISTLGSFAHNFTQEESMKAIWRIIVSKQDDLIQLYNVFYRSYLCKRPTFDRLCMSFDKDDPNTHFRPRFFTRRSTDKWNFQEDIFILETIQGEQIRIQWKQDIKVINNNNIYKTALKKKREIYSCLLKIKQPSFQSLFMSVMLRDYADYLKSFSSYDSENLEELRQVQRCLQEILAYAFRLNRGRIDYERIYDQNFKKNQNTLLEYGYMQILCDLLQKLYSYTPLLLPEAEQLDESKV